MSLYLASDVQLKATANAIREKTGGTLDLEWDESTGFADDIEEIFTGYDVSVVTAAAGDVLSPKVFVNAEGESITGTIATKTSSNLTASGATVTVPAGYYATQATKSVASGSAGTPTASKGTVSSNSISITPSVTNTTGYITGGTKTGTAVTVTASELVSGTKTITASGTTDVTNYKNASVAAGSATTPATTITANPTIAVSSAGIVSVTASASQSVTPTIVEGYTKTGTAGTITVSGSNTKTLDSSSITQNNTTVSGTTATRGKATWGTGWIQSGEINAATFANSSTTGVTYVDISNTTDAPILVSQDYLYINKGYTDNLKISLAKLVPDGASADLASNKILSGYSAYDNDGKLVAGNIPSKSSSDLTASGATVTVPAGYYSSQVTKSVASGSATTPNTEIFVSPLIMINDAGIITASCLDTKSITPTVNAGYVSTGTSGRIIVTGNNTLKLTTQGATTITPSSTSQVAVAAGKYVTGNIVVAGIPLAAGVSF